MPNTLPPLIITSMNEQLYNQYGHRFFETFDRRLELMVYHEDYSDSDGDKPPYIPDWAGHCHTPTLMPEAYRWCDQHQDKPVASYRQDAVRFSHKVWAMWLAVTQYTKWTNSYAGIIWWDADIVFKSMPEPQALVRYLDRADITVYDRPEHPETGVMWFSSRHKEIMEYNSTYYNTATHFVNQLKHYYLTDKIFDLKEQHDAYVTGHILRTEFKGKWQSLSTVDKAPGRHPQAMSESAGWWDHCKGPRKKLGRSPENTQ